MKVLLSVVLTCLIASTVWAQGTLTYRFKDSAELNEWEIVHGEWKVTDGVLRYEGGSKNLYFGLLHKSNKWEFFTLEFRARVVKDSKGSYLGCVVRYQDKDNLHSFMGFKSPDLATGTFHSKPRPREEWGGVPHEDGHCPNDGKCACGWAYNVCFKDKSKGPHDGDWHEFKILVDKPKGEALGQVRYAVWLDRGKDPVIDFLYEGSPEKGKFGLIGYKDAVIEYDFVYIGPASDRWSRFTFAVEAGDKLATTWGHLKTE